MVQSFYTRVGFVRLFKRPLYSSRLFYGNDRNKLDYSRLAKYWPMIVEVQGVEGKCFAVCKVTGGKFGI